MNFNCVYILEKMLSTVVFTKDLKLLSFGFKKFRFINNLIVDF